MRNVVLAAVIGKHRNLQAAALAAFADHPSFPTARKVKRGLMDPSLGGQAAITPISYQQIIAIACHVGLELGLWNGPSAWVNHKIARAGSRRSDFQEV
nr:hypothetical protein [Pararhizobium sp. BT-229]